MQAKKQMKSTDFNLSVREGISSKSNNLLENSYYWIKSIRNVHFERHPVGQLQNNKVLNSLLLTSTNVYHCRNSLL